MSQLIPKLSNNLAVNASDITVKNPLKIAFQKTRNYYNDNKKGKYYLAFEVKKGYEQ